MVKMPIMSEDYAVANSQLFLQGPRHIQIEGASSFAQAFIIYLGIVGAGSGARLAHPSTSSTRIYHLV